MKKYYNLNFKIRSDQNDKLEKTIETIEDEKGIFVSKTNLLNLALNNFLKNNSLDILENRDEELYYAISFKLKLSQKKELEKFITDIKEKYNISISKTALINFALDDFLKNKNIEKVLKYINKETYHQFNLKMNPRLNKKLDDFLKNTKKIHNISLTKPAIMGLALDDFIKDDITKKVLNDMNTF